MFDSDIIPDRVNNRRRYVNDLILLAACLLTALVAALIIHLNTSQGTYIEVSYPGSRGEQESVTYPLSTDGYLIINEISPGAYSITYSPDYDESVPASNVLRITGGKADMTEADCPDLICVHTRPVYSVGRSIICLPHGITATVIGDNASDTADDEYDAVTW